MKKAWFEYNGKIHICNICFWQVIKNILTFKWSNL